MKNRNEKSVILLCLILLSTLTSTLRAGHFVHVWSGNPFNPMTIVVTEAKISGVNLGSGDEVGIFDGSSCVGVGILTQVISPSNSATYLYIICSKDDPGTTQPDGYTEGNAIVYKLYRQSTNSETEFVTHTFPFSPSFVFEIFVQQETAVVSLTAVNVPANRSVQNITVGNSQVACYDATQVITVAGNGTLFQILSGGNATMIAGQMIAYLPGTNVAPGAYLRGYISTNGLYCGGQLPVPPLDLEVQNGIVNDQVGIIVFPNPTRGKFQLKTTSNLGNGKCTMEVYRNDGKMIFMKNGTSLGEMEQDLAGFPAGSYLLRLMFDDRVLFFKIIKS